MKRISPAVFCLAVLCLNFFSCKPKEVRLQAQAGSSLGSVLAEETIRAASTKKNVVIFTQPNKGTMSVAETVFRKSLDKNGVKVAATLSPEMGDPMSYDEFGLKLGDLINAFEKFPDTGAIVSFIGAPIGKPAQWRSFPAQHPPILVVAVASLGDVPGLPGNRAMLPQLLDEKVIQLAIVDGTASPTTGSTDATHKSFAQNFQLLRPSSSVVP